MHGVPRTLNGLHLNWRRKSKATNIFSLIVIILSKADLIEKYGKLDFDIDFYTKVLDLDYLIQRMPDDTFTSKHKKLTKAITDLVQDRGLVQF